MINTLSINQSTFHQSRSLNFRIFFRWFPRNFYHNSNYANDSVVVFSFSLLFLIQNNIEICFNTTIETKVNIYEFEVLRILRKDFLFECLAKNEQSDGREKRSEPNQSTKKSRKKRRRKAESFEKSRSKSVLLFLVCVAVLCDGNGLYSHVHEQLDENGKLTGQGRILHLRLVV